MKKLIPLLVITASGCGEVEPLKITAEHSPYIGYWFFEEIKTTDNSIYIKRVFLDLGADSEAAYSSCFVSKSWHQVAFDTSVRSSSVSFPDAVITQLSDKLITLTMSISVFDFDYDVEITEPPYQYQQQWYIDIDETPLRKMTTEEMTRVSSVTCPDSEQLELKT